MYGRKIKYKALKFKIDFIGKQFDVMTVRKFMLLRCEEIA